MCGARRFCRIQRRRIFLGKGAQRRRAARRKQIGKSHAGARDPVHVGGSDAAAGRSDRDGARALVCLISRHVVRKDHVRPIRDLQARDVDADCCERIELRDQRLQIDDRSAADEELHVRMHHARRNDSQCELPVADHDRMSGVIAAAEARDHVVAGGIQVDDASLSFVAPLQSEDNVGFRRRAVTGQNSLRRPPRTGPSNPLSRRDLPTVWPGDIPSPARSLRPAPRRLPYLLC